MKTLVIKDPSDGSVLGKLKIPDGATNDQIAAAGLAAREKLLAGKKAVVGGGAVGNGPFAAAFAAADAPVVAQVNAPMNAQVAAPAAAPAVPEPERQLMCQVCREVFMESAFAAHCDFEKTRIDAAQAAEARRVLSGR